MVCSCLPGSWVRDVLPDALHAQLLGSSTHGPMGPSDALIDIVINHASLKSESRDAANLYLHAFNALEFTRCNVAEAVRFLLLPPWDPETWQVQLAAPVLSYAGLEASRLYGCARRRPSYERPK